MDYRKVNKGTRKYRFYFFNFIDQTLDRLVRHELYCILSRGPR